MDKKHIAELLIKKKRGVYNMIVKIYSEMIESMPLTIASELIQEELRKESEANLVLNYFSLVHAVYRLKKKVIVKPEANSDSTRKANSSSQKWNFKDANEEGSSQAAPGKFKVG
jgi:hypothetical protein